MVPTEEWVKENFNKYNRKYFGGELPRPRIMVSENCKVNGTDCFGYFNLFGSKFNKLNRRITYLPNNGTICISSMFDRPENDIIGTLLHEMIHEYVNVCLLKYPKDQHGKEFQQVASRINADGWNISESNEMGAGFVAGSQGNQQNGGQQNGNQQLGGILCVICNPNGSNYKFWLCRAEKNQFNDIRQVVSSWSGNQTVYFYQTHSLKLMSLEANPQTLPGFGSMDINIAIKNLANFLGENLDLFMPNNMQKL